MIRHNTTEAEGKYLWSMIDANISSFFKAKENLQGNQPSYTANDHA